MEIMPNDSGHWKDLLGSLEQVNAEGTSGVMNFSSENHWVFRGAVTEFLSHEITRHFLSSFVVLVFPFICFEGLVFSGAVSHLLPAPVFPPKKVAWFSPVSRPGLDCLHLRSPALVYKSLVVVSSWCAPSVSWGHHLLSFVKIDLLFQHVGFVCIWVLPTYLPVTFTGQQRRKKEPRLFCYTSDLKVKCVIFGDFKE